MSAFVYPSSSGVGGGGGGSSGPCGACKFLRRKCTASCIFAPYFNSEGGASNFATVHKVFGASNVSKLLLHIPVHQRMDAVSSICYEAQARLRDPVYGCVSYITSLQQQVTNLQAEIARLQAQMSLMPIATPPPNSTMAPPSLPLPDLSFLIEPTGLQPAQAQAQAQTPMGQHLYLWDPSGTSVVGGTNTHDNLLLQRQPLRFSPHMPYSGRSSST